MQMTLTMERFYGVSGSLFGISPGIQLFQGPVRVDVFGRSTRVSSDRATGQPRNPGLRCWNPVGILAARLRQRAQRAEDAFFERASTIAEMRQPMAKQCPNPDDTMRRFQSLPQTKRAERRQFEPFQPLLSS